MRNSFYAALAIIPGLALNSVHAADVIKADNSDDLNAGSSWVGGATPGSADVAVWNSTVSAANSAFTFAANTNWAGIRVVNPGTAATISSASTLTIGPSGIDMSQATVDLTLSHPVALGASQAWSVATNRTLNLSGSGVIVSGSAGITKTGNGVLILAPSGANNAYTGGTVVNGGVLQVGGSGGSASSGAGTGGITNNNGTTFRFASAITVGNMFNANGAVTMDLNNVGGNTALNGAWSGSGTVTIVNMNTGNRTMTIGGNGVGGGNMNNFSGTLSFGTNSGNLRFNDGGGNANLGSASAAFDLGNGTVTFTTRNRNGSTINFGSLSGGPNTSIKIGSSGSGGTTYSVGARNEDTTFAGAMGGDSGGTFLALTKVGTGTLTLTGPNTYTGATTVNGGTLVVGDGAFSGQLGTGSIVNNASLVFNRSDDLLFTTPISGTGSVTQQGGGTITLNSANSFTGSLVVKSGTVVAAQAGALSPRVSLELGAAGTTGKLDLGGYDLQIAAIKAGTGATAASQIIGNSGLYQAADAMLTISNSADAFGFGGSIQDKFNGSGFRLGLALLGGHLTLTGANTYTGPTILSNATLTVGAGGSISSSTNIALLSDFTELDASASGGLNFPAGYALSGVGTVTGAVAAASSLITPGTNGVAGLLTFGNNLNLNGGVTIPMDLSPSPSSGNDKIIVGGTLNLTGMNTIDLNVTGGLLGVGTYKLITCNAIIGTLANLQLTGTIPGGIAAVLNVTSKEVQLVVTPTGAPFVWHGDNLANLWDFATLNWLSNSITSLYMDGSFVRFDDSGSVSPAVNITGPVSPSSVTVNATVNYTFGGTGRLTGFGTLTKTNSGKLTILTANDYTGPTTISQGTIQVGNGATSGSLGFSDILDNGALVFMQPDSNEITNDISGTGTLSQQGAATLILSGDNSYSGATTVGSGSVQVGNGGTSGSLGSGIVTNNASIVFNRSDTVVQTGVIRGTGSVIQQGLGTTVYAADNTYSGLTTINAGTLQFGNGGVSGSIAGSLMNNGTLAFNHGVDETYSNAITGSGSIQKLGPNVLTLTGPNSYSGSTIISAGKLKLGTATTLPIGAGYGSVVIDGGTSAAGLLDINGFDVTLNGLSGTSNSVPGAVANNSGSATNKLMLGASGVDSSFAGLIEDNTGSGGAIALVKIGAGTQTLAGTNSYSGGTVISNGVLALGSMIANNSGGFSALGATSNMVTFRGGTLQLFGYNGSTTPHYSNMMNPLVVPADSMGTLQMFSRGPTDNSGITCRLTGGGTLNLVVNFLRSSLDGDWSGFTGTINVTPKPSGSGDHMRINNTFGYANASIYLNDGVNMYRNGGANTVTDIGELGGTSLAVVGLGNVSQNNAVANPTWKVGGKNTTATFAGSIINDTTTSVIKVGTGRWNLSGVNSYSGSTTVSNGVLALMDAGSIDTSAVIDIATPGAVLDVASRADGTLNVFAALNGVGTVRGSVSLYAGGTISPGENGVGELAITNMLTLQSGSTLNMDLDVAGRTNDVISGLASVMYAGMLNLNFTATPEVGAAFKLVKAGSYGGAFEGITPATPGPGLVWDTTKLATDGTVKVITEPGTPFITGVVRTGASLTISGTGGIALTDYYVLSTTDIALPLSQWTAIATNQFDSSGNFSFNTAVSAGVSQRFFVVLRP